MVVDASAVVLSSSVKRGGRGFQSDDSHGFRRPRG